MRCCRRANATKSGGDVGSSDKRHVYVLPGTPNATHPSSMHLSALSSACYQSSHPGLLEHQGGLQLRGGGFAGRGQGHGHHLGVGQPLGLRGNLRQAADPAREMDTTGNARRATVRSSSVTAQTRSIAFISGSLPAPDCGVTGGAIAPNGHAPGVLRHRQALRRRDRSETGFHDRNAPPTCAS